MPTLGWKDCVPGTLVQVSDAGDLRQELEKYDESSMPIDSCVSLFAGQRCFVVDQPKTRLQIVESGGRVVCQLVRNDACRVQLPISVLWRDGKEEELRREKEMAFECGAKILQHWWRARAESASIQLAAPIDPIAEEVASDDEKSVPVSSSSSSSSQSLRKEDRDRKAITAIQSQFRKYSSRLVAIALHEAAVKKCCREHAAATEIQCAFRQLAGAKERRVRQRLREEQVNESNPVGEETVSPTEDCAVSLDEFLAAAREGNDGLLHRALTVLGVDDTDSDGSSAFAFACENGHLTTAKLLHANGANLNLPNRAGWTPLHRACFGGHGLIVRWLVSEAGANIAARNNRGSCAAHACVPGGHIRILRMLSDSQPEGLDRCDLLDVVNIDGDSPLHFAVMCRQMAVLSFLLSKEQVSATMSSRVNKDGMTPLQLAVKNKEHRMISLLRAALPEGMEKPKSAAAPARKPKKTKKKAVKRQQTQHLANNCSWSTCTNMQQALTLAWKLASAEGSCRQLTLVRRDIRIILSGLGILEDEPETNEDRHEEDVCVVDLGTAEAVAKTLTAAATRFNFALCGQVTTKRAVIAQKKLLHFIRSPAPALRHIHDTGKVSSWTQEDIGKLLEYLQVPVDALPISCRQSGQALQEYLMQGRPLSNDVVEVSSLLRARVAFHLSILRHLEDWRHSDVRSRLSESVSTTSAGSGAAHALALQRGVVAKATSDDEEDTSAQPGAKLYRPSQSSRAIQRVEEIAELEAQQCRHRRNDTSPPTPPPRDGAPPVPASDVDILAEPDKGSSVSGEIEVVGLRLAVNPRPPSRSTTRPSSGRASSTDIYRPMEHTHRALHTMTA